MSDFIKSLSTRPALLFILVAGLTLCLFLAQIVPHGLNTALIPHPGLTLGSTVDDVIAAYGASDPASYAKAAKAILADEPMKGSFYFNCWPPGIMVLEAVLIKIFPAHLVLVLFLVTGLVWAATAGYAAILLARRAGTVWPALLPLALIVLPLFRIYLFFSGIILSESLSIAFFVSGCLALCDGLARRSYRPVVAGSLLMGLATLFRAQFWLAMLALFALLAATVLIVTIVPRARSLARLWMPGLIAMGITYAVLVGPYVAWNKGGLVHMEYEYGEPWWKPAPVSNFVQEGGGKVLCTIDPKTCTRIESLQPGASWQENKKADLHVIRSHFLKLIQYKTPYMVKFFFGRTNWFPAEFEGYDYVENSFFLLTTIVGIAGCLYFAGDPFFFALALIQLAAWAGSLSASFLIMHFEVRYFYIGKVTSLFSAMMVLAEMVRWRKARVLMPQPLET